MVGRRHWLVDRNRDSKGLLGGKTGLQGRSIQPKVQNGASGAKIRVDGNISRPWRDRRGAEGFDVWNGNAAEGGFLLSFFLRLFSTPRNLPFRHRVWNSEHFISAAIERGFFRLPFLPSPPLDSAASYLSSGEKYWWGCPVRNLVTHCVVRQPRQCCHRCLWFWPRFMGLQG